MPRDNVETITVSVEPRIQFLSLYSSTSVRVVVRLTHDVRLRCANCQAEGTIAAETGASQPLAFTLTPQSDNFGVDLDDKDTDTSPLR